MHRYAKLLQEAAWITIDGIEGSLISKFDVVSVPRTQMMTLVTQCTDPIPDGTGQVDPVPMAWANYWIAEDTNWSSEHTEIVKSAILEYNSNHPDCPLSGDTLMIWSADHEFELSVSDLLSE